MNSGQAYVGSAKRTFSQALYHLLESEYGLIGSRRVLTMLAEDVQALADAFYPPAEHLRSGWMVFTGTKAEGGKAYPGQEGGDHQLVTLAWPVLLPEDVQALATAPPGKAGRQVRQQLLQQRLIRLIEFGWQHRHGPVLLTLADLSLMLGATTVTLSLLLAEARRLTDKPLLTKGYYFDQGVRPTHKAQVIALYEQGVDEAIIARRTHHAQSSVGHYIRDYERVKLLISRGLAIDDLSPLTGMRPTVVNAYVKLIRQYHPDFVTETALSP